MGESKLKITLLDNTPFLSEDGVTYDLKIAEDYCGKIAGICYNKKGLRASLAEKDESTQRRIEGTMDNGHHSVYEHANIGLYLEGESKALNMILNNEGFYATSERSLRYTEVRRDTCNLTEKEINLYEKWLRYFMQLLSAEYTKRNEPMTKKTMDGITKLAQENARYMVSVFINTEMAHTVSLAQLNKVVGMMKEFLEKDNKDEFQERLADDFDQFIKECEKLNVLDDRLQTNRDHRILRMFGENLSELPEEFGNTYSTVYPGSFAMYAQSQRHRIEWQKFERNPENGFYVPRLLTDLYPDLVPEWQKDIESVKAEIPQGELISIYEDGNIDKLISRAQRRCCTHAQLEIFDQTMALIQRYYEALKEKDHPLAKKLLPYVGKRACMFPNGSCTNPCGRAKEERYW